MLKIRLSRTGKKHQPYYRVVVAEHSAAIKGKYVDLLGHYNPRSKQLILNKDQASKWLDHGAMPSNTVAKIFTKEGLKHKLIKIHIRPKRSAKKLVEVKPQLAKVPEAAVVSTPEQEAMAAITPASATSGQEETEQDQQD